MRSIMLAFAALALVVAGCNEPETRAPDEGTTKPAAAEADLHKAFNVAFEVDDETVAKYESIGIDLEKSSGKEHHTVAVPSMFLVGKDGEVLWAHADLDYKTRPTPDQVVAAIDEAL